MSKTKTPTVAELRAQAQALGLDVPDKATKAAITKLIEDQEQGASPAQNTDQQQSPADPPASPDQPQAAPKDEPKQAKAKEPKAKEERRKIETITERGDWTDPFSGLVVASGNDVNPRNGVRREDDEAVLTTFA